MAIEEKNNNFMINKDNNKIDNNTNKFNQKSIKATITNT